MLSITMDDPQNTEVSSVLIKEESNNNNSSSTNGVTKQTVYDVLGNDQELARRHLAEPDEEFEDSNDDTRNDDADKHRSSLDSFSIKRERSDDAASVEGDESGDEESGTSNSKLTSHNRPIDGESFSNNDDSSNGYRGSEYDHYSRNGNSKHEGEEEDRQRQQQQHYHQSEEPEQMRKLFIGGLDYKTSEATLKQHFERFGDVIDCVVMREPQSKRSRGFGFVIYATSRMVDKAQNARPHEVDGREVQSKRAISREDSGKPEAQATVKKVYLGGLSDDIEESELRNYFKEFGNVVNVNIVAHKDTGKRRGFAFVEYDDYDPVDKIVLKKFHTIKDKRIEAKKAIPKVEMDARKRGDPRAAIAALALSGLPLDSRAGRPRAGRSGGGAGGGASLWEGPYSTSNYPAGYSSQTSYGYPPHYHSPSAHYGAGNWMMHEAQGGGPYGFRSPHDSSAYGRSSYANQTSNWTTDYGGFPASQGGGGPMRLSYQHRSLGPYGSGYGAHRGRGYNP